MSFFLLFTYFYTYINKRKLFYFNQCLNIVIFVLYFLNNFKTNIMKRRNFIQKSLLSLPLLGAVNAKAENNELQEETLNQVGFEHIKKEEIMTANTVVHKANTRGHANHGWLDSHHTFSFANYYNPDRMNFGALRVLNDDVVAAARGFGMHPHDNMEIVSIPLHGDLHHKDTTGRDKIIRSGDVQIMSAGTGIRHSEMNNNRDKQVKFLQLWVFPKQRNIAPRYEQKTFEIADRTNKFQTVVSPKDDDALWINQDAYFSLGNIEKGKKVTYHIQHNGNGVYAFIISGDAKIANQDLNTRDGFGIWNTDKFEVEATSDAEILLVEVPMK